MNCRNFLALLLAFAGTTNAATTIGPLTFDAIPNGPSSTMQTIDVPGFHLTGGELAIWSGFPQDKHYQFYSSGPGGCRTCFSPIVLQTAKGARNLRLHVESDTRVVVMDDGRDYGVASARYPLGATITIPQSAGTTYISSQPTGLITVDDISYETGQNQRFVRMTDETPGLLSNMFEKEAQTGAKTRVRVSLGAVFSLRLADKQGPLEPVLDVVTAAEPGIHSDLSTTPAPVMANAIFATQAIARFGTGATATSHRFVASHLGKREVNLRPLTENTAPVTVEVTVVSPPYLGTSGSTTWDARIIEYAHRRGIPPQIIKGTIQQETNFNPTSYRYEPFTTDWDEFSPHAGDSKVDKEPYGHYRMETSTLGRGDELTNEDIDVRGVYDIRRPADAPLRRVAHADRDVTAYELYRSNDYEDEDVGPRVDQRWYEILANSERKQQIRDHAESVLNYPAQTTVAASYGLMQILYTSAIAVAWPGDPDGKRNPALLHDTPANLERDGGSIPPGSEILRRGFVWNMASVPASYVERHGPPPPEWVWPPVTVADWEYMWKLALSQYNGKSRNSRKPTSYGEECYPLSLSFAPGRPLPTFP